MKREEVVVITGANGGIGQELVREYDELGYQVIATDIIEVSFVGHHIDFYKMDLSSKEEIERVFSEIKQKYGRVDILINNGAIANFSKSIFEIEVEEFDKVIAVNLRGAFICSKEFLKVNEGQEWGRIINIGSTRASQAEAGWEAYSTSKGGIVSLTQAMAVSLEERPITVNCISPGWIETGDYEALTRADHKQHPSGRVGKPYDIFKACLYLSDPQNDFINGQNIVIDGGMSKKMIYVD